MYYPGFFTARQRAENQMVDLAQARYRAASKAGRIDTAPRVIRGLNGQPLIPRPSTYQTHTSYDPAREARVAQSMQAGTFGGIRDRYNRDNPGMWMDNTGTITKHNPYIHGGQLGTGPTSVTPATPADPSKPTAPPTPAAPKTILPPVGPPSNRGRIFDNGRDVTEDIQKGLAGNKTGGFYGTTNPHGKLMAQAQKVQDAAKGITDAQQSIDATQRILTNNFGTKPGTATAAAATAPPVNTTPTQAPAVPAPVKPTPIAQTFAGDTRHRTGFQGPVPSYKQVAADTSAATPGVKTLSDAVKGVRRESENALMDVASGIGGGAVSAARNVGKWLLGDTEAKKRLAAVSPTL